MFNSILALLFLVKLFLKSNFYAPNGFLFIKQAIIVLVMSLGFKQDQESIDFV